MTAYFRICKIHCEYRSSIIADNFKVLSFVLLKRNIVNEQKSYNHLFLGIESDDQKLDFLIFVIALKIQSKSTGKVMRKRYRKNNNRGNKTKQ